MNSGTEDEWSGDEGQRIISDATVPSDLETGLEEPVKLYAVDDVREKEKVPKGKTIPASSSKGDAEFDCRYCLLSDSPSNLIAPCGCDGTLLYCHYKCLTSWVKEKRALSCEICGKPYAEAIRSKLANTVAQAEKEEQERRDANLAAQLEGEDGHDNPRPILRRPVARLWCRMILLTILTIGLLYVVLFLSRGSDFSIWTVMLLRVLSFVLPFYLVGRGIVAVQRYRQERARA